MKLVRYFYDSSNVLKTISYGNGMEGEYCFYFEGTSLRKVRALKKGGLINLQYYFTKEDNNYTSSEIEQKLVYTPETKELYDLLKMGKQFLDKFKSLH